ncbi:uncharacterized protein VP01_873g4 [Puccinia sorghi]|uniref:Uncharacterized protein n=1 Tax=Puccinia sorghi TaxID=27349 RepID=A0A0L6U8P6_9BASI|nr:uncharacterized protein VP01_873g4 [Puccinia sorghi]
MDKLNVKYMDNSDNLIMRMHINAYLIHFPQTQKQWGGATIGLIMINCNHLQGNVELFNDYLRKTPLCLAFMFCRQFRMHIQLFKKMLQGMVNFDKYFLRQVAARGRWWTSGGGRDGRDRAAESG